VAESYAFSAAPILVNLVIYCYTICIQLIWRKETFWHFSENTLCICESFSLSSLSNQFQTYQGWTLAASTLTYLPSLEVASTDFVTCIKWSAPNKDHITSKPDLQFRSANLGVWSIDLRQWGGDEIVDGTIIENDKGWWWGWKGCGDKSGVVKDVSLLKGKRGRGKAFWD